MSSSTHIIKRATTRKINNYQRFPPHIYKTSEGLWRGFVAPYDVTYEAKTRKEVEEVLPKMVAMYEDALQKYNRPTHLVAVPLSHEEDIKEFQNWTQTALVRQ